jgi:hypothetical protein
MKLFLVLPLASLLAFAHVGKERSPASNALPQRQAGHYIGEPFGGGLIFSLSADGQHGLIVCRPGQASFLPWATGQAKETGTGEEGGKYSGLENTLAISKLLASPDTGSAYAAGACLAYSVTEGGKTYDDWYLPSKKELNLVFANKDKLGDFDDRYYWTSNEASIAEAWVQSFYDGRQLRVDKVDQNHVLAIRAF